MSRNIQESSLSPREGQVWVSRLKKQGRNSGLVEMRIRSPVLSSVRALTEEAVTSKGFFLRSILAPECLSAKLNPARVSRRPQMSAFGTTGSVYNNSDDKYATPRRHLGKVRCCAYCACHHFERVKNAQR